MRRFLDNKFVFGAACFVLGAAATYFLQPRGLPTPDPLLSKSTQLLSKALNSGPAPVGEESDPFATMQRIRDQMMSQLDSNLIDDESEGAEIKQREDEKFVYFDIAVDGLDKDKLSIKVENRQINISGQVERKTRSTTFNSSFQ